MAQNQFKIEVVKFKIFSSFKKMYLKNTLGMYSEDQTQQSRETFSNQKLCLFSLVQ